MKRSDEAMRMLDPVDGRAPEPDGEELLSAILAVDVPPARRGRARRPLRGRAVLAAAACALAAGVVLAMPGGTGTDVVAAAYDAIDRPGAILHYTQRWTRPGMRVNGQQELGTSEVWQAGDGSRQRVLARWPAVDAHDGREHSLVESVLDGGASRTYLSDTDSIIVYDDRVPELPAPGGVGNPDVGDPRTLLERARSGDETVTELGEATVRGIPVLQFRVGECIVREGPGAGQQMIRHAAVVSVARSDFRPVRVEQPPCREPRPGAEGLRIDEMPGVTVDYLSWEVLPATNANRRLLEMADHPGARVLDGEDIDAEEERSEGAG